MLPLHVRAVGASWGGYMVGEPEAAQSSDASESAFDYGRLRGEVLSCIQAMLADEHIH
jgi:hypothetical protein